MFLLVSLLVGGKASISGVNLAALGLNGDNGEDDQTELFNCIDETTSIDAH